MISLTILFGIFSHYGHINAENFTPFPKNPIIANFFNNIGRADELGAGVRNLYKYTKIYSSCEPIMFEDDVFKVEIPLNESENTDKMPINSDERQEKIILYIKERGSITNKEACELTGLKDSSIKKLFSQMVKSGLIVPNGEKKSRKYLLP